MSVNTKSLRRLYEAARNDRTPQRFFDDLKENLSNGQIKPDEFSIRDLFEEFVCDESGAKCGREIVDSWKPGYAAKVSLTENTAIDTAAFSNISGQIVYTTLLEKYSAAAAVFAPLIPTVATQFNGEKIAGIAEIGDKAEVVNEKESYPMVGTNEDWIQTPETKKRGLIVPVTREAVFFDRTGQLLQRAGDVGTWMGVNREKRAIDCIIDENTTTHRYNRKNYGTTATYGDNSGTHNWDNLEASNGLVDWTDVDNLLQLLDNMRDPNTGEPIVFSGQLALIHTRQLRATVQRVLNATQIQTVTPGYATSGNPSVAISNNPVASVATPVSSTLLADRLATDTSWFLGYPSQAFRYMENWPLQTVQAPVNSEMEFTNDIVMRWKASERGAYATVEPRCMTKATA